MYLTKPEQQNYSLGHFRPWKCLSNIYAEILYGKILRLPKVYWKLTIYYFSSDFY